MFRNIRTIGGLLLAALLSVTVLISVPVQAASTCNFINSSATVAAGALSIPANAMPNTPVKSVQNTVTFQCRQTSVPAAYYTHITLQAAGTLVAGYNDVYQTNINGLGVRFTVNAPNCTNANNLSIIGTGTTEFDCPFNTGTSYVPSPMTYTTTFVVTGLLPASAILTAISGIKLSFTQSDIPGGTWQATPLTGVATGSMTAATCSVNQTSVDVKLAPVTIADLAGQVGKTAAPKGFMLSLTCPAGIKTFVTLTDSSNIANRSNTLGLTSGSSAQGVGIQILDGNDTPVAFGPDSAAPGNTNQFQLGTAAGGSAQYPLKAQYISTGHVRAGSVQAIATFTLSYQ
ncbi:TPA: fimbrial protein [Serratia fonticola]